MTNRFTARPTPRNLAFRLGQPAPPIAPPAAPAPAEHPIELTYARADFERAIRYSDLHPLARLVAFLLAHFADPVTGVIPAVDVPALGRLARAAGIDSTKARKSIGSLSGRGWMSHGPNIPGQKTREIRLAIPAGQRRPRAR
jgi:hypothetical protein